MSLAAKNNRRNIVCLITGGNGIIDVKYRHRIIRLREAVLILLVYCFWLFEGTLASAGILSPTFNCSGALDINQGPLHNGLTRYSTLGEFTIRFSASRSMIYNGKLLKCGDYVDYPPCPLRECSHPTPSLKCALPGGGTISWLENSFGIFISGLPSDIENWEHIAGCTDGADRGNELLRYYENF